MSDNSSVISVEAPDPAKKTSEILGPMSEEATVRMDLQNEHCYWNDAEFSQGDQVTVAGKRYECSYTRWLEVDDQKTPLTNLITLHIWILALIVNRIYHHLF